MKKFIFIILMVLIAASAAAYRAGDQITYRVVCHYNNGTVDTGCSKPSSEVVFWPNATSQSPNTLAEISDSSFPGLWAGNYTIPAETPQGTLGVYIKLKNSNLTEAATVLSYSVENLSTDTNISLILSNQNSALLSLSSGIQNNMSKGNSSIISNLSGGIGNVEANTITTLSNQAVIQALIRNTNTSINTTINSINISMQQLIREINLSIITDSRSINDTSSILTHILNINGSISLLVNNINTSIQSNFSLSSFSSSVSTADKIAIGKQCAAQTLGANLTTIFNYNKTSLFIQNLTYNYSGINLIVNESFTYNNESYLNLTTRVSVT